MIPDLVTEHIYNEKKMFWYILDRFDLSLLWYELDFFNFHEDNVSNLDIIALIRKMSLDYW